MKLNEMRLSVGLSQAQLASMSGVNLRTLQDYEQGHKSIASAKGETLLRLSHTLGYSIEQILEGSSIDIEFTSNNPAAAVARISAYERGLNARKQNIVHFPIIESDDVVDMSRIYPTKQHMIKLILNDLRTDSRISSLYLFGSSISMACHKDSDIDLAVEISDLSSSTRNDISERIQLACDWGADIIWMDHLSPSDRIYTNIMKGLVLI